MDDYPPIGCHSACIGTPCRLFAKGITSRPVYNTMPRIHFFPTSAAKTRNPAVSFAFSVAAAFTSRPTIRPALSSKTISTSLPDALRQKKIYGVVSLDADCLTGSIITKFSASPPTRLGSVSSRSGLKAKRCASNPASFKYTFGVRILR
jgi:hypothetical protein